jgi:hypothetical protein
MPKSTDLSVLFRSLGPDDSSFQASEATAARQSTQRWPLFQAVSPKKPDSTPTLTTQERQRWSPQEQHELGESKPALSLPVLSDKMAMSLGKMSGRTVVAPVKNLAKRAPLTAQDEPRRSAPMASPVETRSAWLPASTQARQSTSVEHKSQAPGLGLFGSVAGHPLAPGRVPSEAIQAGDSLASVFSRLEGKPETVNKMNNKKSSFLNRLGKL